MGGFKLMMCLAFAGVAIKFSTIAYVTTSKNAPIPYYGWHDNPNVRWITLEKNSDGFWEIASLATGP